MGATDDAAERFGDRVQRVAALAEPVRRDLYRYVAGQPEPVSREQAATAVGVAAHVAKFHLDRLETDGLLEAQYSRPPGRRGPGAGRPAKRYRRSAATVSLSLPERRYELAGQIMANGIDRAIRSRKSISDELPKAAAAAGRDIAHQLASRLDAVSSHGERTAALMALLADFGYEPRIDGDAGAITLENCPFHALAKDHVALVCGMNLDMLTSMLGCCDLDDVHAQLTPSPNRCCVTLTTHTATRARPGRG